MRQRGTEYAKRILDWAKNGKDDSGLLRIMEDMTSDIIAVLELNDVTIPAITNCLENIVENNVSLMREMNDGSLMMYETLRKVTSSVVTTVKVKGKVSLDE